MLKKGHDMTTDYSDYQSINLITTKNTTKCPNKGF